MTDVIALGYRKDFRKRAAPVKADRIYQGYLGDVIICPKVAKENSKIYKNVFFSELTLYLAHGILHLLGYDDRTRKEKLRMRKKESDILKKLSRL